MLDISPGPVRKGCGCLTLLVAVLFGVPVFGSFVGGQVDAVQVVVVVGLFFLLPLAVTVGLGALVLHRTKTWLEGTVLVRQGVFRASRLDLAQVAEISTDSVPDVGSAEDRRVPILVIRDEVAGVARLRLRTPQGWLPSGQLLALADVIGARQEFRPVADWLRKLATDPQARVW